SVREPRLRRGRGDSAISAVHDAQRAAAASLARPRVSRVPPRMVLLRAADLVRRSQAAPLTAAGLAGSRPGGFLVVAPLVCALLSAVRHTIPAGDGLAAQYFDNPDAIGAPFCSVIDRVPSSAQVQRRWGDMSRSAFSIVWTGYLTVGSSGTYAFA